MEIRKIIDAWPIIAAVISTTTAFGAGFQKISTLEQAVTQQVQNEQVIQEVKTQQAAADARQRLILDQVSAQRKLLEQMLLKMNNGD